MAYQILCNTAKVVLRGKLLVMQACLKKEIKRFQVNKVILHLKKLEREQTKFRISEKKNQVRKSNKMRVKI